MEHPLNLKRQPGLKASLFLEELRPSDLARAGLLAQQALERLSERENAFRGLMSQNRVTCRAGNAPGNSYRIGLCGGFRAGAWFVKYDYDNAYRLKSLITKNNQGDIIDGYSYIMDNVGNRTSMTSLRDNQVTSYEYDSTYRLTKATYPWDAVSEQFTYDVAGNRTMLVNSNGTLEYKYDAANRLEKEYVGAVDKVIYSWDAAGNMLSKTDDLNHTSTYEWNYDSRLLRSTLHDGRSSQYGYDPSGIRVRLTEGTTTKRFLYSKEDIIAEYGGASEMYYVHGPLVDEPLAQLAGTTLSYMHRDGLGSVTAFSDDHGLLAGSNSYTSFGTVHETSGVSSRYGYTSRELDQSGMMYYRSRYYQPEIGRFLNQDFYQGQSLIPPSLHRYTYTHNNPISYADPYGLFILRVPLVTTLICTIVGAVLGGLLGHAIWPGAKGIFWGAFIGGLVALSIVLFFQLDTNIVVHFINANIAASTAEITMLSHVVGRFLAFHYGTHLGAERLFHIHLFDATPFKGWYAVLFTAIFLLLTVIAVTVFFHYFNMEYINFKAESPQGN